MGKRGPRQSKCVNCERYFDTDTMQIFSGKKYCEECAKEKGEEVNSYKALSTYIYETIYARECNMPMITKHIASLKKEHDWTYKGMLDALKYAVELEEVDISDLDSSWGIHNLLLRYYEESRKFYEDIETKNSDEEYINYVLNKPPVYVYIKRSELEARQKRAEEERRRRYGPPPMSDEEVEAIVRNYEENGTREHGSFLNDKGEEIQIK